MRAAGAELSRRDLAEWRRWGPYLSERAWGTVREDYSADGDAWSFFPHDHARSRAYHGEDAKEYWWYLDSTPTHSWMRWRYVYPQNAFPYDDLRVARPRE